MSSVLEQLKKHASQIPDHIAVAFEDHRVTYGELWEEVVSLSTCFKKHSIKQSDCIVVQSCYTKYFVIACYAAWLNHCIFVPVDENASSETLENVCNQLGASCCIAKTRIGNVALSLVFDELDSVCSEKNSDLNFDFPKSDEFANIMFTTGTTGNPKSVIWSHKNIYANVKIRYEMFAFDTSSVDLSCVPLNHAAPLWKLYALNFYGGTAVFVNGMLRLRSIYSMFEKYGVNSVYMAPSGISIIQNLAPEIFTDHADKIKILSVSSSAMTQAQRDFIQHILPKTRSSFSYGSSESGGNTIFFINEDKKGIFCVGKPCTGVEVKIVDEEMKEVSPGQTGRVTVKSDMTFAGYWGNKALSEEVLCNGYYVSNDLGYVDEEGFLFITGRKDDIINVGGLKVYPSEIENAVSGLEQVEECICFPTDDSITKQAVCLDIKLKSDAVLTVQDIKKYLLTKLDSYKVPKFINFREKIAKTPNGKPDRRAQARLFQH